MTFEVAARVADAVLLEGYVLYPYRASSAKNRYRWTFGVLAPRAWSEAGGPEPWWLRAEVPIEWACASERGTVRGVFRFLRVLERRVQASMAGGGWCDVDDLTVSDKVHVTWEEGEITEVPFALPPDGETGIVPIDLAPTYEVEPLADESGLLAGRVIRRRAALRGRIEASASPGAFGRVTVRVENLSPAAIGVSRAEAVRSGFASSHVLLAAPRTMKKETKP